MKDIYFSVRSSFRSNILAQSQLNSDTIGLRYLIGMRTVTFLPEILYANNFKNSASKQEVKAKLWAGNFYQRTATKNSAGAWALCFNTGIQGQLLLIWKNLTSKILANLGSEKLKVLFVSHAVTIIRLKMFVVNI